MAEEAAYWQSMSCQSWHTNWAGLQNMEHSCGMITGIAFEQRVLGSGSDTLQQLYSQFATWRAIHWPLLLLSVSCFMAISLSDLGWGACASVSGMQPLSVPKLS